MLFKFYAIALRDANAGKNLHNVGCKMLGLG